jgi:hypothetical protein
MEEKTGVIDQSNGNGHNPNLDQFVNMGLFDGAFTSAGAPSAIREFVERGEKVEDLLLRGFFRDANHMNAVVRLYRKAVHFDDKELQQLLLNHAAGYPAIQGQRIDILLKAVVGQMHIEQKSKGLSLRRAFGMEEKKEA